MRDPKKQIDQFFQKHRAYFDKQVPGLISKTAVEYYKGRFREKNWDGRPWPATAKSYKPRRGSLMVRSAKLMNSIVDSYQAPEKVVILAGNSKVPYARIHNEGGEIRRKSRSETFQRKRSKGGKFQKGTTSGRGFSFRASVSRMPQRQFLGYANQLNDKVISRFKDTYKFK